MKRITIIALILQLFVVFKIDIVGAAAWSPPNSTVQNHQLTFLRVRDEYQLMYALDDLPAGTYQVRANFWSTTDVYYSTVFDNPTKVAYLTCNGTYIFEMLDSSGNTIGETRQINTTKIANPPCQSYENAGLKNDINAAGNVNSDKSAVDISWNQVSGADKYQFYFNGELMGDVTEGVSFAGYPTNGKYNGLYTIAAVDSDGNVLSSGDFIVNEPGHGELGDGDGSGGNGDGGSNGSCDACKWLTDMLACPAWQDYMGELTQAIKNALPPPTDWEEVADIFVDNFAEYFGDVPAPPTKTEIESEVLPSMPSIDTNVPESSMTPTVPDDFNNGPLDTDITSGEQIEIIDESEAFEIYEPDEYINADPVGTMVYPNDDRNSSDGIDNPMEHDFGYNEPTPQPLPQSTDIPNVDMPTPTALVDTMPLPTSNPITTPTPQPNDWIIPLPEGGITN